MINVEVIFLIFGIVGIIGAIASTIALFVYFKDRTKIEPRVIQTFQRVMDTGNFLIQALVSNLGNRTASNCSAKIYTGDNPIEDLSFVPIDSPLGRIGRDWPKATSFKIYPKTQITLRRYLGSNHEGAKVHVKLFLGGKEVDCTDEFTITKPKP